MKNERRTDPAMIGKLGSLAVFAVIIFVALGCDLDRLTRAGDSSDIGRMAGSK